MRKPLIHCTNTEAKEFFLLHKSYCNLDIPKYFDFSPLLNEIDKEYLLPEINEFKKAHQKEKVNHSIVTTKDNKYAWREFQLIHPLFYVHIVNEITKTENWEVLIKKIKDRQKNCKTIKAFGIPIVSKNSKFNTIMSWWENIEQSSIQQSLEYKYIYKTDIADCYPSIYAHSIPWAIHGKSFSKKNRGSEHIGNFLDENIKFMSYGQTNGIPQGSNLMDFIAEILLSYYDEELYKKLEEAPKKLDYCILRYRDDYRIFTNSKEDGEFIIKYLSEILLNNGLKLNVNKTNNLSQSCRKG